MFKFEHKSRQVDLSCFSSVSSRLISPNHRLVLTLLACSKSSSSATRVSARAASFTVSVVRRFDLTSQQPSVGVVTPAVRPVCDAPDHDVLQSSNISCCFWSLMSILMIQISHYCNVTSDNHLKLKFERIV